MLRGRVTELAKRFCRGLYTNSTARAKCSCFEIPNRRGELGRSLRPDVRLRSAGPIEQQHAGNANKSYTRRFAQQR